MIKFDEDGFALESGFVTVFTTDEDGFFLEQKEEYVSEGGSLASGSYLDNPPPQKEKYVIKRESESWQYIENHKGETYYSKETKEEVEIKEYGPIPETLTNKKPLDYSVWDSIKNDWVVDENLLKQAIADKKAYLTELSTNKARDLKKTVSEYADDDGQHLEALYWRLDNSYPAPQLTQIAKRLGLPLKKVVENAIKQIPPQAKRKGDYVADDVIFKNKIKMASTMKQLDDVETEINNWK